MARYILPVLIIALLSEQSSLWDISNYHAKAKSLIADGHFAGVEIVDNWNGICPALVLYFDNNRPMPIREYRWDEYWGLINERR